MPATPFRLVLKHAIESASLEAAKHAAVAGLSVIGLGLIAQAEGAPPLLVRILLIAGAVELAVAALAWWRAR